MQVESTKNSPAVLFANFFLISAISITFALYLGTIDTHLQVVNQQHPEKPMAKVKRPYGSWQSPISSTMIASGAVRLEQVMVDGCDIYWIEGRSQEGGRNEICRMTAPGSV